MREDGDLDINDVECFVNALLNLESCVDSCPLGTQPGSGDGAFAEGGWFAESSESSGSTDAELLEAVQEVLGWLDANPYAQSETTLGEYIESLQNVMIDAGLLPED